MASASIWPPKYRINASRLAYPKTLGNPLDSTTPECALIRSFIDRIGELRPQLITFNGHSFDLPVLRYRAMVNRVSAAGLQVRPYFHRYTEDALDLCDVF